MLESVNFFVDDSVEMGFVFDDGVWDIYFFVEGRKEDDEFNGVNIVGDEDKRSFFVFD